MTQNHSTSEIDRIHEACRKLSMHSVSESLADVLQEAAANNLSHAGVLAALLETEIESRSIAAQRRRIRSAAFPQLKYLHDLIREDLPNKPGLRYLNSKHWILSVKDAIWCSMVIPVPARHIWLQPWVSSLVRGDSL